jgi:Xaa-Pro aminopeptidase
VIVFSTMLNPEYHKNLFDKRRQNLLQLIKENNPFLTILFNSPVYPRGSDAFYPHKTDSSFFYLTGVHEEESAALLYYENKKLHYELFVRPNNEEQEMWNGSRLGPEGALKAYQPNAAFSNELLEERVQEWFKKLPRGALPKIYSNFTNHPENFSQLRSIVGKIRGHIRNGIAESSAYIEVLPYVRHLRLIKDKHELGELQKASNINVKAHLKLMEKLKPGMTEYQAQAILEGSFIEEGARGPGYGSILASASNATILHYHENSRTMKEGELLLADAGCEYKMYQSDITRTLPVGKKYSEIQRKLMDIVLEAQQEAIGACVEGNTLEDFHQAASLSLIDSLKSLKLIKGSNAEIFEKGLHKKFYPHGTGHWLGLDVHDPCPCFENGKSMKFKAGMVLTVEPGLYFSAKDNSIPKELRGVGIRIEDDLVIQPGGKKPLNLTSDLPKSWKEIESVKK